MRTRSDLHSMLGTSHTLQAYYSLMVAVLYIYIFKCMRLYKLCIVCMGCQKCTHHCYIIHASVSHTPGWVLVQEVSLHCVLCLLFSTQFVSFSDYFFPVHSSLDSGSKFPFVMGKFPEISVLTKTLFPGTILHVSLICGEQSRTPCGEEECIWNIVIQGGIRSGHGRIRSGDLCWGNMSPNRKTN